MILSYSLKILDFLYQIVNVVIIFVEMNISLMLIYLLYLSKLRLIRFSQSDPLLELFEFIIKRGKFVSAVFLLVVHNFESSFEHLRVNARREFDRCVHLLYHWRGLLDF